MTTVWLWDADGPARSASGVTADDDAAKDAARQGMITTGAVTAMVEQATHLAGGGRNSSGREGRGPPARPAPRPVPDSGTDTDQRSRAWPTSRVR